jgi:DNA repair exonuclease SbcCD ATPase subunit
MKILSVSLQNFASYNELNFDFQNQGLTLIQGPTGSGKSTLCDAIPWVLFGTTAKGGAVTEVLSWPGASVTEGKIVLDLDSNTRMELTRKRGAKAKDNDLYYNLYDPTVYRAGETIPNPRGKDIADTQRLINERLGCNAETYLAGAYYHEFSQTAQFFQTNAKNRRLLCEQLVDLSLAKNLQEKIAVAKKCKSKERSDADYTNSERMNQIQFVSNAIGKNAMLAYKWEETREARMIELLEKHETFEEDKTQRLEDLRQECVAIEKTLLNADTYRAVISRLEGEIKNLPEDRCHECGSLKASDTKATLVSRLHKAQKDFAASQSKKAIVTSMYDRALSISEEKNTYLEQLEYAKNEKNPHLKSAAADELALAKLQDEQCNIKAQLETLKQEEADLELLSEIIADFRSQVIKNTILGLETQTNALLSEYFDAEIRVEFSAQDADKIEVQITKDGNQAVFTQLSKGQRQMLKLCFGLAVMKQVGNHNGLGLNAIFLDEATDGLDESMKAKAFRMLQSLQADYESIFLVDHSTELKAVAQNQYVVALTNEGSKIEKAQ